MTAWKIRGLAATACLALAATAACEAKVTNDTKSSDKTSSSSMDAKKDNEQSVNATGGVTNKAEGQDSEQNIGSTSNSNGKKSEKSNSESSSDNDNSDSTITDPEWKKAASSVDKTIDGSSGSAAVYENGGNIRVKGDLDQLSITGSNNTVIADNVKDMAINSSNGTIFVKSLEKVDIFGSNNTIVYAQGSAPAQTTVGDGNKIRKAQ